jgi:hypothetical protein
MRNRKCVLVGIGSGYAGKERRMAASCELCGKVGDDGVRKVA